MTRQTPISGVQMKFLKDLMLDGMESDIFLDVAGATAIEYGLIAALIAVAAIAAMQGLGSSLSATFNTTSSTMSASAA
jgi:pilus assembly protein Flp/PilA